MNHTEPRAAADGARDNGQARSRATQRPRLSGRTIAMLAAVLVPALSSATVISTSVSGLADIYLAGQPNGSSVDSDSAPLNSPTLVGGIKLVAGNSLTFFGKGATDGAGCVSTGPDGCGGFSTGAPANNISSFIGPEQALIGLFLGAAAPSSAATGLNFANTAFTTLAPGLGVVFFIGDGLTGNGTGTTQTFTVPTGATRLFLATSDGVGASYNNSGMFSVSVNDGISAPPPPAVGVPEPGAIGLVALGAMGLAIARRRAVGPARPA